MVASFSLQNFSPHYITYVHGRSYTRFPVTRFSRPLSLSGTPCASGLLNIDTSINDDIITWFGTTRAKVQRRARVSDMAFNDLDRQLMSLYGAKEYQQAFELVERERLHFPEQRRQIAYWRLCMHALTGKQTESLQIFRE